MLKKIIKNTIGVNSIPYWLVDNQYFYRLSSKEEIVTLKDKYKGKRCVIVGNGPSLNKIDLSKLEGEYSFAVNGIFYKTRECGYKPTFYVVEDTDVMLDNVNEINQYSAKEFRFFPKNYKHLVKSKDNTIFFNMDTGYYNKTSPHFRIPRFSADMSRVLYCGQSVTMINLQIAYYLGFSEVYLIGMDFSYNVPDSAIIDGNRITSTEDDNNHFHPDYFGRGKVWHDPELDKVLASYKMMKLVYEMNGRKIYNATAGGKLEIFERVDFNSVF
ncbi:DUF115 domain-containing protein [Vibrio vulnificus]|nr:DUF115 domain-containing protein [Vibrio vulnificus]